jgi:hypothetical protein
LTEARHAIEDESILFSGPLSTSDSRIERLGPSMIALDQLSCWHPFGYIKPTLWVLNERITGLTAGVQSSSFASPMIIGN